MSAYTDMVAAINSMSDKDLEELLGKDMCPFQPELIPKDIPIGMFHCEVCGTMIVAGAPHPRYKELIKEQS
jgi:hypothetical protein